MAKSKLQPTSFQPQLQGLQRIYKIVNAYNYTLKKQHLEKNNGISLTVPDQTMTIPQLLERQRRGLPLDGNYRQPIFTGEDDILEGVDPRTLDLSERQELVQRFRDEFSTLTEKNKKALLDQEAKKLAKATGAAGDDPGGTQGSSADATKPPVGL